MPNRKFILIVGALAIILAALFVWLYPLDMTDQSSIAVNKKELRVKIADTPEERESGLQGVTKLDGFDAMLFIFEKKETVSFWNKNTLLDLDLVWIAEDMVIGVDFLPKTDGGEYEVISSPGEVDKVLELPRGKAKEYGIKKGTLVR